MCLSGTMMVLCDDVTMPGTIPMALRQFWMVETSSLALSSSCGRLTRPCPKGSRSRNLRATMMMSFARYVPKPSSLRYTMTTNTYVESASLPRKVPSLFSTCVSLFLGLLSHLLPPFLPSFVHFCLSYLISLPIEQILDVPFKSVVDGVLRDTPSFSFHFATMFP